MIDPTPEPLGARLQRLRKARGLSQRELARRAGVPNGSVSMIEQGRVSPSVATLEKLVAALPMTLADFFGKGAGERALYRAADACVCAHRGYRVAIVAEFAGRGSRFLSAQLTIESGASCAGEWLPMPASITAVLLFGAVEAATDAGSVGLGVGDVYRLFSRHSATLINRGGEAAELALWCELALDTESAAPAQPGP